MEMRRFELVDGSADKFWSIGVEGARVVVHYGRNGTNGQVKEKTHGSAADAATDVEKQVAGKVKKGYVEAGSGAAPAAASTPAAPRTPNAPAPAPAPVPAAPPVRQAEAPEADRDVPAEAFEPGDLGFRWHPLELAALPEGPAAPVADPEGTPQDVVAACEAAAEAQVVADTSDYRRHEWVAGPRSRACPASWRRGGGGPTCASTCPRSGTRRPSGGAR
ncbi:WGR domain-containing protein [Nocardioides zeae]